MLLLTSTTDKIQVITGQAVTTDVHASWVDYASGATTPGRTNTAITTATTTDVVAAPASSTQRNVKTLNVRNKHATSSVDVTVVHTDGTTAVELIKITLNAGDTLEYIEGVGFYKVTNPASTTVINQSVADQTGFAADTYLVGSNTTFPTGVPRVGTAYKLRFDMSKTAAGVAAPVLTIRTGTAGTTSDTARLTFTLTAGTAAIDIGSFDVICVFRTVGSGTSAVLAGQGGVIARNVTASGISSDLHGMHGVSSGFDSTTAGLIIGASFNGGASFVGTCNLVRAELIG